VSELTILKTKDQADAFVSEELISEALDWFDGEPRMATEEFIDRLCNAYATGWDLESYDNEAARSIMKRARKMRKERQ
jgi:hypothetical protein